MVRTTIPWPRVSPKSALAGQLPQLRQELKTAGQLILGTPWVGPKGTGASTGCVPEAKGDSFEPELNQRPKDGHEQEPTVLRSTS